MAHILVVGLGDIGAALAQRWHQAGHRVSGIRRHARASTGIDLYAQDLISDPVLLPPDQVDLAYVVMSPASRSVEGYQDAFLTAPRRLLDALAAQQPVPPVVFVSSTAVYGDQTGLIDEESPPRPDKYNGRILLAAEEEMSLRSLTTIVRFSGIYGPGRLRLIRQAQAIAAGEAPPAPSWTNRIHRDDCVGLLEHLGQQWLAGNMLPPVVVGTDLLPSMNVRVLNWLGERLGLPLALPEPDIGPGKRLHSRYIESSDFTLSYTDFQAGYEDVLASLSADTLDVTR